VLPIAVLVQRCPAFETLLAGVGRVNFSDGDPGEGGFVFDLIL